MSQDLTPSPESTFTRIAKLIEERRTRAVQAVNTELIGLYWEIGKILSTEYEIHFTNYAPSFYILKLYQDDVEVAAFKIIKN